MDETTILVIGIGNEYRNDDALGLIIVRSLKNKLPHTKIIEISGDSLNLIDIWKDAKGVIIVDAVSSESVPGTIFHFDALAEPIPKSISFHSTHAFSIAESIGLGRTLHQLPPNLLIFGIEGKNFAIGTKLSPEVENAMQKVTEELIQIIQDFLRTTRV